MIEFRNALMKHDRQTSIVSLVIVVLACDGCFPRPDYVAPGFVPDSAFSQGIVVAGVALHEDTPAELMYARFLEKLLKKQKHYKVAGVSLVKKSLGAEKYAGLMKQYRDVQTIDKENLEALAGPLAGYRYIVFVHFDKSDVYS